MTNRNFWKHGIVLAFAMTLSAGPAWCAATTGEQGCTEAEKIIAETNTAKSKAKEYSTAVKDREKAKTTWDESASDEREKIRNKGHMNTALNEAKDAKTKADEAVEKKTKEIADDNTKIGNLTTEIATLTAKAPRSSEETLRISAAQAEKTTLSNGVTTKEGELRTLKATAKEAETKQQTAQTNFDKAKEEQEKATKKTADDKTAYDSKQKDEDQKAKDRVTAAQTLLKEHHKIGKTAMRCPKYQLTGAGSALWQTWKTGTKTLTAAMDKQMDLFAKTGTQTQDQRVKDAKELGGFESGTAQAKTFEKNITDRIQETTTKRDQELAVANQKAAEIQAEKDRVQAEVNAGIEKRRGKALLQQKVAAAQRAYDACLGYIWDCKEKAALAKALEDSKNELNRYVAS